MSTSTTTDGLPPRTVAYTVRVKEQFALSLLGFAKTLDKSPTGLATELLENAIARVNLPANAARKMAERQLTIDDLLASKGVRRRAAAARGVKRTKKRASKKKS